MKSLEVNILAPGLSTALPLSEQVAGKRRKCGEPLLERWGNHFTQLRFSRIDELTFGTYPAKPAETLSYIRTESINILQSHFSRMNELEFRPLHFYIAYAPYTWLEY